MPELPTAAPTKVTGASLLIRAMEAAGVELVFGIPGGAILPAYDPLMDSTRMRHVLVRHEQGAGHAAAGYAQTTGRVGVCMATSGPGATNLVTPLADAYMDSVPVVAITGQVAQAVMGTMAFQEADICAITKPITKRNYLITDAADIPRVIADAFYEASHGRPGPVLVDIPKDVLQQTVAPPPTPSPHAQAARRPRDHQVREAARLIRTARRPVLYVGGGVLKARATEQLTRLAELTGMPVVTTLMARGAFPDSHPQHLGMPGMHGTVTAVAAMQRADLLVALGSRFDDRVTGKLSSFAPDASVVHADIDPAEISKNRTADVSMIGDCREIIAELVAAARTELRTTGMPDYADWWRRIDGWRETCPLGYSWPEDGGLAPQYVIERIGTLADPDARYVSGVGQHQMWAAQFLNFEHPGTWVNSGGLGTMGFAVPAALGVKLACPDTLVWAIDGDGSFQMTNQELVTCAIEAVPIKVAVINNGSLGMVRQWQHLFYGERYSNTDLDVRRIPDLVLLAESMGCAGLRCDNRDDVDAVIKKALDIDDRPVVIDFVVAKESLVWPMVAAGTSNDEIMAARDIRPLFDAE